ncbi:hypothetical protein MN032_15645 [Agromyces atrinae]|uniref:hypothetical protein n=1 Tax=Agromyces atrinae TaxID=592376 RepID=UPI001F56869F|nr:hypothetical protein [Agromyces atrinae]MCI2959124.1 hypothetical protein [Agromyces atrinae]
MTRSWTTEPAPSAAATAQLNGRAYVTSPWLVTEHLRDESGRKFNAEMTVAFDPTLGKIVCVELKAIRSGEGGELTGTEIRKVAVQEAVRVTADQMVEIVGRDGRRLPLSYAASLFQAAEGRDRNEVVEDAAHIYVVSEMSSRRPLADVARLLGVSQSTATRLVAEARSGGLLGDG